MTGLEIVADLLAEERTARLAEKQAKENLAKALDEMGEALVADAHRLNIALNPRTTHVALYALIMKAQQEQKVEPPASV